MVRNDVFVQGYSLYYFLEPSAMLNMNAHIKSYKLVDIF